MKYSKTVEVDIWYGQKLELIKALNVLNDGFTIEYM